MNDKQLRAAFEDYYYGFFEVHCPNDNRPSREYVFEQDDWGYFRYDGQEDAWKGFKAGYEEGYVQGVHDHMDPNFVM